MALSLIDTTTASGDSSAPSVTAPSGSSGDLLIVVINYNADATISDNNGGTPCTEDLEYNMGGAGGGSIAVYSREIGGSEPANYAFTLSASNRWAMTAFLLRDHHGDIYDVVPAGAHNQGTPASSIVCDEITTLTDGAWAIAVGLVDNSAGAWDVTDPSGWTTISTVNSQQPQKVVYW